VDQPLEYDVRGNLDGEAGNSAKYAAAGTLIHGCTKMHEIQHSKSSDYEFCLNSDQGKNADWNESQYGSGWPSKRVAATGQETGMMEAERKRLITNSSPGLSDPQKQAIQDRITDLDKAIEEKTKELGP
jgi:hypothetical protein